MNAVATIAKNTLVLGIGQVAFILLSLALVVVAASELGVNDFGAYSFAFAVVNIFFVLTNPGLSGVMIRNIARRLEDTQRYYDNAMALSLGLGVVAYLAIIAVTSLLQPSPAATLAIQVLGVYVVLSAISGVPRNIFKAHEKMQYEALTQTSGKLVASALGIAALILGFGLLGLTLAFVSAGIVINLLSLVLLRKEFVQRLIPKPELGFAGGLLKESLPFALVYGFSTLYERLNIILLSLLDSEQAVGVYSVAYRFLEGLSMFPGLFVLAIYPALSRFFAHSKKELQDTYTLAFKMMFLLGLPMAVGTTLVADKLIALLFPDPAYAPATLVLQILIWGTGIGFFSAVTRRLLFSANRQGIVALVSGIGALATVGLNLWLVPLYSFLGTAAAYLSVRVFMATWLTAEAWRRVCAPKTLGFIPRALVAVVPMSAFLFYLPSVPLLVQVPGAVAVYGVGLLATGALGREDWEWLRKAINIKQGATPN